MATLSSATHDRDLTKDVSKDLSSLTDAELAQMRSRTGEALARSAHLRIQDPTAWDSSSERASAALFTNLHREGARRKCVDECDPAGAPPPPPVALAPGPPLTDMLDDDALGHVYAQIDAGAHFFLRNVCKRLRDACPAPAAPGPPDGFCLVRSAFVDTPQTYTKLSHASATESLIKWTRHLRGERNREGKYVNDHGLRRFYHLKGASAGGHVRMLFHLLNGRRPKAMCRSVVEAAVKTGQFESLAVLLECGAPFHKDAVCKVAAEHGHLRMLQWLCCLGYEPFGCDAAAVRNGHMFVAKWLVATGIHQNPKYYDDETDLVATAAARGRTDDVRQLKELLPAGWLTAACTAAAENGHLECLQVAVAIGCPMVFATCESAAANGHLDCLQFLLSKGCPCDFDSVIGSAAAGGHIACLKWAWGQGGSVLTIEEQRCLAVDAVIDDFYDVLKCLRVRLGCAWDERVVHEAAKRNRMPILKLAWRHGLGPDYHCCLIAVEADNYDLLAWLCNQGTPLHARVLTAAIKRNSYCMATKLMEHDCPANSGTYAAVRACGDGCIQEMFAGCYGGLAEW